MKYCGKLEKHISFYDTQLEIYRKFMTACLIEKYLVQDDDESDGSNALVVLDSLIKTKLVGIHEEDE